MIDSLLSNLKRGAERVQQRSEAVAQAARLRVEVFQLSREQDALFARLGRAYHSGAAPDALAGIQDELRRVEDEIASRERLIGELGEVGTEPAPAAPAPVSPTPVAPAAASAEAVTLRKDSAEVDAAPVSPVSAHPAPPVSAGVAQPADVLPVTVRPGQAADAQPAAPRPSPFATSATPVVTNEAPTAVSVWKAKQEARMNERAPETAQPSQDGTIQADGSRSSDTKQIGGTDITGRPDGPDPTTTAGGNPHGNPSIPNSDTHRVLGDATASQGNEAGRDEMFRHANHLKEGKEATLAPDPLDK